MLIEQLKLTNLLSFGSTPSPTILGPLNLIIGPNGSGKSNLLEAIDVLRSAPDQLAKPTRESGGVRDWIWKGAKDTATASIESVLSYKSGPTSLRYMISFSEIGQR